MSVLQHTDAECRVLQCRMVRSLCIFGDSLLLWRSQRRRLLWSAVPEPVLLHFADCIGKCLCVCLGSGGESELCSLNINTKLPPSPPLSSALPLMHPSLLWLPFSCTTNNCPLSTCDSHYKFPYSLMVRILTRWALSGGEERVTAACRWRACGSCWLWRLLYARG